MRIQFLIEKLEKLTDKKVILKENINYPDIVYHFTTPNGFINIIKKNYLRTSKNGYVSFTEDPELWVFKGPDDEGEIGVKLIFKTNNLKDGGFKKVILEPYIDYNVPPGEPGMENEKEWRVNGIVTGIKQSLYGVEIMEWALKYINKVSPNTLSLVKYKTIN